VRLRVTNARIEAWIDARQVVDLPRADHTLTMAGGRKPINPFGFAVVGPAGCLRNIKLRRLAPETKESDRE
jgi:hypothetical protein